MGLRLGASHAARLAIVFTPSFLALLPLAISLLTLPWLDSREADAERDLIVLEVDAATRDGLAAVADVLGGSIGLSVIGVLGCAVWLLVLRSRMAWSPRAVARTLLARLGTPRHVVLAVLVLAATTTGAMQWSAGRLGRWVDLATVIRPMGPQSLAAIAASQAMTLLALGACAGATIAALEVARMPRARLGAAAILVALGILSVSVELGATAWIQDRCDLARTLSSVLASSADPERLSVVVAARDRTWRLEMPASVASVAFDPGLAARAEALLDARRGWTHLAPDLEAYVLGERLVALDPDGARATAERAIARRGSAWTGYHLLASLASAHPTEQARGALANMTTASWLRRGPLALHLISVASCAQGDRAGAEGALRKARNLGESRGRAQSRGALPLILSDFTDGRVSGRILLDGAPLRGRIGLVAVQDVFGLPAKGDPVPFTWLLRIGAAMEVGPDGSFAFDHVIPGEHALVMIEHDDAIAFPTLPRIAVTANAREEDLGTIELHRAR